MAHHLRKENNCLNCGATVTGRYCSNCGQENIEPREGFWHLALDFLFDLFHFDSKFFKSLKYLFFRPGFLTKEYISGKRKKYLHPVKMYIFTSAFFFLIFFTFINKMGDTSEEKYHALAVETVKGSLKDSLTTADSAGKEKIQEVLAGMDSIFVKTLVEENRGIINPVPDDDDTAPYLGSGKDSDKAPSFGGIKNLREYDSLQNLLPEKERDGYLTRLFTRRSIEVFGGNQSLKKEEYGKKIVEKFFHNIPTALFLSLPLLALILQLLYIRKKHSWYYVDHVVFLLHAFVALFLLSLVYYGFIGLYNSTDWRIFKWTGDAFYIYSLVYIFLAMYFFYSQGFWKTLLKFLIFFFLGAIVTVLVASLMIGVAFFTV
ncbi:MAG: DUF3667 domain-containing protein [Chitinophagaceae bacterium]|nr:DUF3667 domain-containing protein [Chitinophagaceae bacterium]